MSKITNKFFFHYLFFFFLLFNYSFSSLKFNIPNNREKCFSEEVFSNGTLLIRYDLKGIDFIKKDQNIVLKNIKLFIKDPRGKTIHDLSLTNPKDKFAIRVDKEGYYYICARYYKTWSVPDLPKEVLLGIKLRSDYEYMELEQGLAKKDLYEFKEQINNLKYKMIPSLSSSKNEIEEEDKIAKAIISTSNLYFMLTLIQMILIVIIGFYQIFNVKAFLSNKRII